MFGNLTCLPVPPLAVAVAVVAVAVVAVAGPRNSISPQNRNVCSWNFSIFGG